jgi:hypothetical protein
MHIDIPAIPAPAGIPAPTPNTGEACHIRQSDGTPPELKRPLDFTAPIEENAAGRESITMVRSTNPDYVNDQVWRKLRVWVHNWVLQTQRGLAPREGGPSLAAFCSFVEILYIQHNLVCYGLGMRQPAHGCNDRAKRLRHFILTFLS